MNRSAPPRRSRLFLAIAALMVTATPLAAQQFSANFNFFKGVRARDGAAVEALVANPSSTVVNTRDPDTGEGAVHILTRGRDRDWLNYMLAHGAQVDFEMPDGTTALQIAAQISWVEGAELLLSRGANVNKANRRGETPLILAVHARDLSMVRLLMTRGADANRTDSIAGFSALDYARREGRDQTLATLIENMARARPTNRMGPSLN